MGGTGALPPPASAVARLLGIVPCPQVRSSVHFTLVDNTKLTQIGCSRSRIIRVSASYSPDATDAAAQTLTITASLLSAHNAFSDPTPPAITLPTGCHLEPDGCAYESPRRGPGAHTPDRGLSVDVLAPSYTFSPLFTITSGSGAVLASGRSRQHALKVALRPIDVVVPRSSHTDEIESAMRNMHDVYSLHTGRMPPYVWPTKWLLGPERAGRPRGALRGVRDWMGTRGDEHAVVHNEKIEGELRSVCGGFHLEPRTGTPSGESGGPSTPIATTPGRNTPTPAQEDPGDDVPRRARVGPNGGPAMLWQANRDPQDRPGVAIIRAGGENGAQVRYCFLPAHEILLTLYVGLCLQCRRSERDPRWTPRYY